MEIRIIQQILQTIGSIMSLPITIGGFTFPLFAPGCFVLVALFAFRIVFGIDKPIIPFEPNGLWTTPTGWKNSMTSKAYNKIKEQQQERANDRANRRAVSTYMEMVNKGYSPNVAKNTALSMKKE